MKKLVKVARNVSERILYLIGEDEQIIQSRQTREQSPEYWLGL